MSTGISISSINRIKELAEEKRYAEALEILDTQNLEKSINPQFLRISGEIFRENKRYYDSRKILLKAHQMSPQGIRIIFELIQLYLELGYFTRAKIYYEQYKFYSTPEDTQRDYVEYMMRKAEGADAKELSVILIPILERMPEDRWNFEAVLLYDKLGRKDKALEECKYILENFKNSVYVEGIVKYIDNILDIDACLYVYPKEEQEEDFELYGDLIAEEDKILKEDYLSMYPPEARIMVEAEDKDAIDVKPAKEKKSRKKKKKSKDDKAVENEEFDMSAAVFADSEHAVETAKEENETEDKNKHEIEDKKEREAVLEQLLSKKLDADKIKESARQVAKAVKEIDTAKAKSQVKSVAESVKDNVKKATDVLGEAVGAKAAMEETVQDVEDKSADFVEGKIVDGIIESVIEEPKKVVGQVVTNEELDALIPDSLEAMSAEEIADLELKREEAERRELEALEAELDIAGEVETANEEASDTEQQSEEEVISEETSVAMETSQNINESETDASYEELKAKFLETMNETEEEQPLDSLGFITVVQSDVDKTMEEEIPEAANILHQMIDNKEFYVGEDSNKFESKESYDNHDFEIEDYDFDSYLTDDSEVMLQNKAVQVEEGIQEKLVVEEIFAEEQVVNFDEIIPEEAKFTEPEKVPLEETVNVESEKMILEESVFADSGNTVLEEAVFTEKEKVVEKEPIYVESEEAVMEEPIYVKAEETVTEETIYVEPKETVTEEFQKKIRKENLRKELRTQIMISDRMHEKLLELKESR